jgi:chorismate synthase
MNTFGKNIKISFSGTSHGAFISVKMEGLPSGRMLDETVLRHFLGKRRPKNELETGRIESDDFQILSGITSGITDGSPLEIRVPNRDLRPQDYAALQYIPRPGHADYPAYVKNPDFFSETGGGIHSGRLTVLFSLVGAIAFPILKDQGVRIVSHLLRIGDVEDVPFDPLGIDESLLSRLEQSDFPVINETQGSLMRNEVARAKSEQDSVGGVVESMILGMPPGIGDPWFDSVESWFSHLLFSIPVVKGVEFGDGFSFGSRRGSEVKDEYIRTDGKIRTMANHNGGVLGGLTTGMPILVRTVVKPTSSIGQPQKSVHLLTGAPVVIQVGGRHDACIAFRAVHVITAALLFGTLDMLSGCEGK